MEHRKAATAYQRESAGSASRIGIIVALYDTLLRDFRRALAAQASSDVETRVAELNHVMTVIGHLRSVLNHEAGGEAARRFRSLYDVTHGMILEANLKPCASAIEKLIAIYGDLRGAWYQAEQNKPAAGAEPQSQGIQPGTPQAATNKTVEMEQSGKTWSA